MKTEKQIVKQILKATPEVSDLKIIEQYTRLCINFYGTWGSYTLVSGVFQNDEKGFMLFDNNKKMLEKNTDLFPDMTDDVIPIWDYIEEKYKVRIDSFNNDYN
jgi:hypothetical protein